MQATEQAPRIVPSLDLLAFSRAPVIQVEAMAGHARRCHLHGSIIWTNLTDWSV